MPAMNCQNLAPTQGRETRIAVRGQILPPPFLAVFFSRVGACGDLYDPSLLCLRDYEKTCFIKPVWVIAA